MKQFLKSRSEVAILVRLGHHFENMQPLGFTVVFLFLFINPKGGRRFWFLIMMLALRFAMLIEAWMWIPKRANRLGHYRWAATQDVTT